MAILRLFKRKRQLSRRRKWARRLIFLGLLVIIIISVKAFRGPAEGTVRVIDNSVSFNQSYSHLTGKHFKVSYLTKYKLSELDNHLKTVKEAYELSVPGSLAGQSRAITITVYDLPDGNLDNNSSYQLRKTNPGIYKERVVELSGSEARFYRHRENSDNSVFIKKANRLAVIAAKGDINAAGYENEFNYIVNSFSWR